MAELRRAWRQLGRALLDTAPGRALEWSAERLNRALSRLLSPKEPPHA